MHYTQFYLRQLVSLLLTMFSVAVFSHSAYAENLAITNVNVTPQILKTKTDVATIHFQINKESRVTISIYDSMDALMWRSEPILLPTGEHSIVWQGQNTKGERVVPEAYYYVIEAQNDVKEMSVYDLTDITGGESAILQNVHYDGQTKKLTFTAPKTGRYLLRVGIARAFAINTLVNNKIVIEGEHQISWDGFDASHQFDASHHPQLQFGSFGYGLSHNFIIVKPPSEQETDVYKSRTWIDAENSVAVRAKNKISREGVSPQFYRAVNLSRDVLLQVTLPENIKKNKNGAYIFETETPFTIDVLPTDVMVLESQRGEIVLFLDNQLIHDNEVSYYPYTFKWKPPVYDGHEHLLTAFVAGFAGNIGIATLKVQLGSPQP